MYPCPRDRQTQELRRGQAGDPALGRAPAEPVLEKPHRGLAPANAATPASLVLPNRPCRVSKHGAASFFGCQVDNAAGGPSHPKPSNSYSVAACTVTLIST